LISSKTAEQLIAKGIAPDSSFEDLIHEIEKLGYNKISLYHFPNGYRFTMLYKGNIYVFRTVIADSRKEAIARALILIDDFE